MNQFDRAMVAVARIWVGLLIVSVGAAFYGVWWPLGVSLVALVFIGMFAIARAAAD